MSRKEFMEDLEIMLENIQDNEREEALQYYNDYFDEAGPENEEQVIRELGTPAKVAAIIKTSLHEQENQSGEFTERGYSDPRFTINYEVIDRNDTSNSDSSQSGQKKRKYSRETSTSAGKILLIIILCMIVIPVAIPILTAVIGLLGGILGLAIVAFATIAIAAVAFLIGGIVVFVVGIVTIFSSPITGIFSCGIGLIMAGVGILFALLTTIVFGKFIPWLVRGIVDICRMPFRKRGII